MSDYYILRDREVIAVSDVLEWAEWFEEATRTRERVIALTKVKGLSGDVVCKVSTVFLGLDHAFVLEAHAPVVFETMVFGGLLDQEMDRCTPPYENAIVMHEAMVERVGLTVRALAATENSP